MKFKRIDRLVFNIIAYTLISIAATMCLLPFITLVSGSITPEENIVKYGYDLMPNGFSLKAYSVIFKSFSDIGRAYGITILTTALSTSVGLIFSAAAGYVLSRKDFEWRNGFALFLYFTTLFGAGLVPTYIWFLKLGLKNNILALIFPHLFTTYNIFLLRNGMKSIPDAITESAQLDGLNDLKIFIKMILPLSTSTLATIGLFIALGSWNEWYNCMLYISDEKLHTLQYYLNNMLTSSQMAKQLEGVTSLDTEQLPTETAKLAMTVVATGPIVLAYPFVQKYFVQGITVGAVKG